MLLLNSCREWRLLRSLKATFLGKLARHRPERQITAASISAARLPHNNTLAFIETELLLIFRWELPHTRLSEEAYEEFRVRLVKLCQLLDGFINRDLITVAQKSTDRPYPGLNDLLACVNASSGEFSLISGSYPAIFAIPSVGEATETLDFLGELNEFMMRMCKESQSSFLPSAYTPEKGDWQSTSLRDRARKVLETFFRHFGCELPHNVLLQLSDAAGMGKSHELRETHETLEMLLSCCSDGNLWHEVQCVPYEYAIPRVIGSVKNIALIRFVVMLINLARLKISVHTSKHTQQTGCSSCCSSSIRECSASTRCHRKHPISTNLGRNHCTSSSAAER